ncbi:MAG: DUF374 domain-containing protein [Lentisphaerae bacterium]|nr:DUF374 domain-containing protein [Lentisphaerota bacterium]
MSFKQKFRQLKKLPTWIYWFPATLMKLSFRFLYRYELIDPLNLAQDPSKIIAITWHNRLMFICMAFPKQAMYKTSAVISASRDGQYLSDFMKFFHVKALRGSSSKKGANALLGAIREIESGRNVVFTPDGPRGPKYVIKNGPVVVASKTGGAVVPIVLNASKCWSLKSWDNFQIPKPFSTLQMIVGEPIYVPADADENTIEFFRKKAEQALLSITVDPADAVKKDADAKH